MGDGQHCLAGKAFTDGLLEQLVCLLVHACCGLIDTQDLDHVERMSREEGEEGPPWLLHKPQPPPPGLVQASPQLPTSSSKRKTN